MNDKRQYDDSKIPFSQRFWNWFQKRPPLIRGVLIGVVLLALLRALLPQSLFHSFNCQVQNVPLNSVSSNGYFIDNQVIIVGQREDIEKVITAPTSVPTNTPGTPGTQVATITPVTPGTPPTAITLLAFATPVVSETPATPQTAVPSVAASARESGKVALYPIEDCDLSYLNYRRDKDSVDYIGTGKLVMQLYEIPSTGKSVEDTIADINEIAANKISADPNYITSLSDLTDDPCGLPTDPGSGGGRAGGVPGPLSHTSYDARLAEKDFINQWAFGPNGVNFPNSSTFTSTYTGSRVRVGVFDTSPYRISFPFAKGITMAFPSPLWFPNWDAGGTTAMSSHGLFVASLIHRIAPSSSIQLVRALNEDGCGQLWVLNKGLEEYKSIMSRGSGRLDQTVINMSLGIRVPQKNKEIGTLKKLIKQADDMGAIVVAAAGNDSRVTISGGTKKEPMQIPASYENVIGVVATNKVGQRSCYSNIANGPDDVAAPGGDNGTDPQNPDNLCYPRATSWDIPTREDPIACQDGDIKNCQYGVISLVETRYGTQYMLWSGTSFAAPLVSGMAALAYQNPDKEQALCAIYGKPRAQLSSFTELGSGLINIGNNLTPTILSRCPPSPSYP